MAGADERPEVGEEPGLEGVEGCPEDVVVTLGGRGFLKSIKEKYRHKTNIVLQNAHVLAQSLQSCRLCDFMDCSLPGSSVCGIFQARILEWVVMPSSRGSSQPRD